MTDYPANFDSVAGLKPREHATIGVLSIGLKREVLQDWARAHDDYSPPTNLKGKVDPVVFKAGFLKFPDGTQVERASFFIKSARGVGPEGAAPRRRYRPMLAGFDKFNLTGGQPWGQTTFYGYLPAGEITIETAQNADGETILIVHAPFFSRQRKAQKLGRMVKRNKPWKEFERVESYSPPRGKEAPSNLAECRGDGESRVRWEPNEAGEWAWRDGQCLNHDCPFAEVCPVTSQLMVHSDARQTGESILLRYENQSANTTANIEGFLLRIAKELRGAGMVGELYGLPIRMEVEVAAKSAGVVMGRQLAARRYPVVKIGERRGAISHRQGLAKMLAEGGGRLALPEAPQADLPPAEEGDSAADFSVEPPGKPRLEVVPVAAAAEAGEAAPADGDVIDVEATEPEPGGDPRSLREILKEDYAGSGLSSYDVTKILRDAGLLKKDESFSKVSVKRLGEIPVGEAKAAIDEHLAP